MGSQYYYFVSSLPSLDLHQKTSVSYEDFLSACKENLSPRDMTVLAQARIDIEPEDVTHVFLHQWALCNRHLKNDVARLRARKFSQKEADVLREGFILDPLCTEAVSRAAKAAHPLEGERILDEARWKKIEELSSGYYFDVEALIAYALKVQIINRQQLLSSVKGRERFERYREEEIFEKMVL